MLKKICKFGGIIRLFKSIMKGKTAHSRTMMSKSNQTNIKTRKSNVS